MTETEKASAVPSDMFSAFRGQRHFGSLDGLRALSVVAVVWHHTVGHDANLPYLFSTGSEGVSLFFAISGMLIVTLLLREQAATGGIDLRAFYIRRSLRIFPLYYSVLCAYAVLVLLLERNSSTGREFLQNVVFFATYTSNWFVLLEGRVIFYFAWSLAAEEQFYLLWPTLQRWLTAKSATALIVLVIVVVITSQALGDGSSQGTSIWYRILNGIPLAICFGVLFARLLHHRRTYEGLRWIFGWRCSSPLLLGVALWILQSNSSTAAIHLSLALLVVACVYREDHFLAPLLRNRVLAFLGSISYGIYLLHMLVKNAIVKVAPHLGFASSRYFVFVATTVCAVAVAALSFKYFESYFLRKKRRYVVHAA